METVELTDKTKQELIELILTNGYEKIVGKERYITEETLAKERQNYKHLSRVCCELCILLMAFMVGCFILLCMR